MHSSVITFPGSNCDRDMDVALKKFGFKNKMVWHDDVELPKSDLVVLPGGLFSYGNEMTRENNPLEIGLGKFCSLDGSINYIGRQALEKIASNGVARKIRGIMFDGEACPTCSIPWPVMVGQQQVGQITSGIWSPRLKANVGQSLIERGFWEIGQELVVVTADGQHRQGKITTMPMA